MPYFTGLHVAGASEATRMAQAIVHGEVETAMLIAAGARAHALRAGRVPEASEGERIRERPSRGRRRRDEGRREPSDQEPDSGSLFDARA